MEHGWGTRATASQARDDNNSSRSGNLIIMFHVSTFLFYTVVVLNKRAREMTPNACGWERWKLLTKAADSNVNPRRFHEAWLSLKEVNFSLRCSCAGCQIVQQICAPSSVFKFDVLRSWNEEYEGDQANQLRPWSLGRFFSPLDLFQPKLTMRTQKLPMVNVFFWMCDPTPWHHEFFCLFSVSLRLVM